MLKPSKISSLVQGFISSIKLEWKVMFLIPTVKCMCAKGWQLHVHCAFGWSHSYLCFLYFSLFFVSLQCFCVLLPFWTNLSPVELVTEDLKYMQPRRTTTTIITRRWRWRRPNLLSPVSNILVKLQSLTSITHSCPGVGGEVDPQCLQAWSLCSIWSQCADYHVPGVFIKKI